MYYKILIASYLLFLNFVSSVSTGAVVDSRIKLTASSLPMLEDTFMVLSCDEIKLAWLKNRLEDSDQPTDSNEEAEMAGIVIKKTIISQVILRVFFLGIK